MTQWVQPDNLHFRLIRVRTSTAGNLTRYILKIEVKWRIGWEELNGTYGEKRNECGFLEVKPQGNGRHGRPRCR
jgi:hypothetical protein